MPGLALGNKIKDLRDSLGITQKEFCEVIGLNVGHSVLSRYERGLIPVPHSELKRIATYFGKDVNELFGRHLKASMYDKLKVAAVPSLPSLSVFLLTIKDWPHEVIWARDRTGEFIVNPKTTFDPSSDTTKGIDEKKVSGGYSGRILGQNEVREHLSDIEFFSVRQVQDMLEMGRIDVGIVPRRTDRSSRYLTRVGTISSSASNGHHLVLLRKKKSSVKEFMTDKNILSGFYDTEWWKPLEGKNPADAKMFLDFVVVQDSPAYYTSPLVAAKFRRLAQKNIAHKPWGDSKRGILADIMAYFRNGEKRKIFPHPMIFLADYPLLSWIEELVYQYGIKETEPFTELCNWEIVSEPISKVMPGWNEESSYIILIKGGREKELWDSFQFQSLLNHLDSATRDLARLALEGEEDLTCQMPEIQQLSFALNMNTQTLARELAHVRYRMSFESEFVFDHLRKM